MAKYDNLLQQDLFELFGNDFMEKVLEEEHGKYLTEGNKERIFSIYKKNGIEKEKAVLLLSIIKRHLSNDKELDEAYEKQDIGRLLATE